MAAFNLSRRAQIAVAIGALILGAHFYFQIFYKPAAKRVRELKLENTRLKEELSRSRSVGEGLTQLETQYQSRMNEVNQFEAGLQELEAGLPSRKEMSKLLEQLTMSLEGTGTQFVSLEPVLRKAEEGGAYDSLEIELQFYGDFAQVGKYLEKLEATQMLLGIRALEMELASEESKKPLVTIRFSTFLSDYLGPPDPKPAEPLGEKPLAEKRAAPEPFHLEARPYDKRLAGEHHLTMVVWQGGRPAALIDGKVMKEGSLLENKTISKIESEGVWFMEDGIQYYLGLER